MLSWFFNFRLLLGFRLFLCGLLFGLGLIYNLSLFLNCFDNRGLLFCLRFFLSCWLLSLWFLLSRFLNVGLLSCNGLGLFFWCFLNWCLFISLWLFLDRGLFLSLGLLLRFLLFGSFFLLVLYSSLFISSIKDLLGCFFMNALLVSWLSINLKLLWLFILCSWLLLLGLLLSWLLLLRHLFFHSLSNLFSWGLFYDSSGFTFDNFLFLFFHNFDWSLNFLLFTLWFNDHSSLVGSLLGIAEGGSSLFHLLISLTDDLVFL